MPQQMIWFFVSIAFSLVAWGVVTARYIWPELRLRERAEALRPLLVLHSFRFIGLTFLVPGVVSPDLPPAFAHSAAYGDISAAMLALLALLSLPSAAGATVDRRWLENDEARRVQADHRMRAALLLAKGVRRGRPGKS